MARIVLIYDYGNRSVHIDGENAEIATIYQTLQEAIDEARDTLARVKGLPGDLSITALDLDDLTAFPV